VNVDVNDPWAMMQQHDKNQQDAALTGRYGEEMMNARDSSESCATS
jgi:hypothetical protein